MELIRALSRVEEKLARLSAPAPREQGEGERRAVLSLSLTESGSGSEAELSQVTIVSDAEVERQGLPIAKAVPVVKASKLVVEENEEVLELDQPQRYVTQDNGHTEQSPLSAEELPPGLVVAQIWVEDINHGKSVGDNTTPPGGVRI